jgi:hypothetical protein
MGSSFEKLTYIQASSSKYIALGDLVSENLNLEN